MINFRKSDDGRTSPELVPILIGIEEVADMNEMSQNGGAFFFLVMALWVFPRPTTHIYIQNYLGTVRHHVSLGRREG